MVCPDAVVHTRNATILNIELDKGYWRVNPTLTLSGFDLTIYPCLMPLACGGGKNPDDYCTEGHGGVLCGVCEESYYFSPAGKRCIPCKDAGTGSESMIMIGAVAGLFGLVLLAFLNKKRLTHIQKSLEAAVATAQQLNAQGEDHLDNLVSDASAKKDNHRQYVKRLAIWYKGFKIKGKILFVCCKCRPNSSAYLVVHFSRPDSLFARQINLCPPSPLTAM